MKCIFKQSHISLWSLLNFIYITLIYKSRIGRMNIYVYVRIEPKSSIDCKLIDFSPVRNIRSNPFLYCWPFKMFNFEHSFSLKIRCLLPFWFVLLPLFFFREIEVFVEFQSYLWNLFKNNASYSSSNTITLSLWSRFTTIISVNQGWS